MTVDVVVHDASFVGSNAALQPHQHQPQPLPPSAAVESIYKKILNSLKGVSNFNILLITTILFGVFVIAEVIGALASNSLSLLGDAAAMSVDVFTYLSNMYAERKKARDGRIDPSTVRMLEVYIPTFSVCALLGVTGWIAGDAIIIIINDAEGNDDGGGGNVDVSFLFAFASVNFVIDAVSALLFYVRRKDVLTNEHILLDNGEAGTLALPEGEQARIKHDLTLPLLPNLNMISALTHVGSDTLRTLSVFGAAIIATAGQQNSSLCDAWAAVVVTSTIVMAVVPLCGEIYKAAIKPCAPLSPLLIPDVENTQEVEPASEV